MHFFWELILVPLDIDCKQKQFATANKNGSLTSITTKGTITRDEKNHGELAFKVINNNLNGVVATEKLLGTNNFVKLLYHRSRSQFDEKSDSIFDIYLDDSRLSIVQYICQNKLYPIYDHPRNVLIDDISGIIPELHFQIFPEQKTIEIAGKFGNKILE